MSRMNSHEEYKSLYSSIKTGEVNDVSQLLKKGCIDLNCNFEEQTALHVWVESSSVLEIGEILLQKGASCSSLDETQLTPIHLAVKLQVHEKLSILLKSLRYGDSALDIQDDNGNTALHMACTDKNTQCVNMLISSGPSASIVNNVGETPLHIAAKFAPELTVTHLMQYSSCEVTVKASNRADSSGAYAFRTPVEYAIAYHDIRSGHCPDNCIVKTMIEKMPDNDVDYSSMIDFIELAVIKCDLKRPRHGCNLVQTLLKMSEDKGDIDEMKTTFTDFVHRSSKKEKDLANCLKKYYDRYL